MKLTTAILAIAITSGAAWAQGQVVTPANQATTSQKPKAGVKPAVAVARPAKPAPSQAAKVPASPVAKPAVANSSHPVAVVKPVAKSSVAAVSKAPASVTPVKTAPVTVAGSKPAATKPAAIKPAVSVAVTKPAAKPNVAPASKKPMAAKQARAAESKSSSKETVSVEKAPEPAKNEKTKTISASGRRDPFISPVVNQSAVGSGCSSGKRCLAVDQISLKGVVKAETGMIAVVVNALDKAYFLRENDPVFDGYVLKITGDSIVFKETVQDKLGKPFTREVTKKISTPAV